MGDFRVSCHLITWGEEFETGLKEAREIGYRACETFTNTALAYEDDVAAFQELLEKHDLRLSALYGGGRFSDPAERAAVIEYNTRVARFLQKNGVEIIVFGPQGPRTEGGTSLEELKHCAETINEAAKRCFEFGVKACVHPHLWTEIQDRGEIDAVMEMTDPDYVFLAPDTAHLTKAGMDPAEIIEAYRDRVGYVHLKDVMPEGAEIEDFPVLTGTEALPVFAELGLGPVDFRAVIAALERIEYNGWLTVEIDQSTSTPYESLTICRDYLQNELGIEVRTDC